MDVSTVDATTATRIASLVNATGAQFLVRSPLCAPPLLLPLVVQRRRILLDFQPSCRCVSSQRGSKITSSRSLILGIDQQPSTLTFTRTLTGGASFGIKTTGE